MEESFLLFLLVGGQSLVNGRSIKLEQVEEGGGNAEVVIDLDFPPTTARSSSSTGFDHHHHLSYPH